MRYVDVHVVLDFDGTITARDTIGALAEAGITVPDPGELARLRSTAELVGLRRAGTVIAIVPDSIDGTATARHPVLAFATHDVTEAGAKIEEVEKTAHELVVDGTWKYGDAFLPLQVPEPHVPDAEAVKSAAEVRTVPAARLS